MGSPFDKHILIPLKETSRLGTPEGRRSKRAADTSDSVVSRKRVRRTTSQISPSGQDVGDQEAGVNRRQSQGSSEDDHDSTQGKGDCGADPDNATASQDEETQNLPRPTSSSQHQGKESEQILQDVVGDLTESDKESEDGSNSKFHTPQNKHMLIPIASTNQGTTGW